MNSNNDIIRAHKRALSILINWYFLPDKIKTIDRAEVNHLIRIVIPNIDTIKEIGENGRRNEDE